MHIRKTTLTDANKFTEQKKTYSEFETMHTMKTKISEKSMKEIKKIQEIEEFLTMKSYK